MIAYSDDALAAALIGLTAHSLPDSWTLRLYSNDYDPVVGGTGLGSFTESAFTGYASQSVGTWNAPAVDMDGNTESTSVDTFTFTKDAGPLIEMAFGWYVTDDVSNVVMAERLPSPARFDAAGDELAIQLRITFGECHSG